VWREFFDVGVEVVEVDDVLCFGCVGGLGEVACEVVVVFFELLVGVEVVYEVVCDVSVFEC